MANINVPQLAAEVSAINLVEEDAPQIDYTQIQLKAPVYKYRQLQQVSGGSALTLSSGSTTLSQFNVPNIPINLAKSYITMDLLVNSTVLARYTTIFTDCIPLNYVRFKPEIGDPIVDIQNAQVYTKVIQPLTTPMDKYLSRTGVFGPATLGVGKPLSEINGCQPAGTDTITDGVLTASVPTVSYIKDSGAFSPAVPIETGGVTVAGGKSQQHVVSSIVSPDPPDATSRLNVRFKIPLAAFAGSILAMDKTICFGGITQLYLQWQAYNAWGFQSTSGGGNSLAFAQPVVSNYYLYIAEDISESGREIEMLAKTSGLSLYIPYTVCSQYSAPATGVQDVPVILTPGTGYSLKRIITVPSATDQTLRFVANTDNVAGVQFTGVQSYLDSKPLQDYKLLLADGTLWNHMSPFLENTPLGMGQRTFEINNFFMDNFSDCSSGADINENDFKASGLSITQTRNYSARYTLTQALVIFIYSTWLRRLVIKPSGLSWAV